MQVLGLDPSLRQFGWAIHETTADGSGGCVDRGRFRTSAKQLFIDRYCQLRENLRDLLRRTGICRVGLEFPVFNDLWSEGMYGLFLYCCEALRGEKRDVVFLSPMQTKAHARLFLERPKGWKMMKGDMVEAASAHAGGTWLPGLAGEGARLRWNHNEADAYWAAVVAGRFYHLLDGDLESGDLTAVERKQFTEIHTFQRGKKAGTTVKRGILYREDERFFRWSLDEE